jgi:hypothetical protein
MSFTEACRPLFHPGYFIPGWHQNPHLQTAQYVRILRARGETLAPLDYLAIDAFVLQCRLSRGLFKRWPHDQPDPERYSNNISHDELMAIAYLGWVLGRPWARGIYEYGRRHWFAYESHTPERLTPFELFRFNLNRIFDFRAFVKLCMGERPSLLQEWLWCRQMMRRADNPDLTNISGRILGWLQLEVVDACGTPRMKRTAARFREKLSRNYPGGPAELLAGYYHPGAGYPGAPTPHPYGIYAPMVF